MQDSVAQLVEQYTFNVWVLGSSPSGITQKKLVLQPLVHQVVVFVWWPIDGMISRISHLHFSQSENYDGLAISLTASTLFMLPS